jgi:hypothetical protein
LLREYIPTNGKTVPGLFQKARPDVTDSVRDGWGKQTHRWQLEVGRSPDVVCKLVHVEDESGRKDTRLMVFQNRAVSQHFCRVHAMRLSNSQKGVEL